jgi:branched-chain amino acid transport system permease protein
MAAHDTRSDSGPATAPRARWSADRFQLVLGMVLVAATAIVPEFIGNYYWIHSFQLINLLIIAAVFQNLLTHDAGQISFGQSAIFGAGAYAAAIAMESFGAGFAPAMALSVLVAVVAGLLYAMPALRVQGYYLGFVTLSAAVAFPELVIALDGYTNGVSGIPVTSAVFTGSILGISTLTLVIVAATCAALAFHAWLRTTSFGRALRASAASPEAAQSLGINTSVMRCLAFTIAAAGTGIAGCLYTPVVGYVSPSAFGLDVSIVFFLAVIVGGSGHLIAPIIGIWILYLLPNILLVELANYRLLAYGGLALVVMLAFPDGLVGTLERWRRKLAPQAAQPDIQMDGVAAEMSLIPRSRTTPGDIVAVAQGRKTFGSVVAIDDVDWSVKRGEIHGLVGANGSGKTSLLNVVSGFSKLQRGTVSVASTDTGTRSPASIARLGLGRTFQTPRIFETMSVRENLLIGLDRAPSSGRASPSASQVSLMQSADAGTLQMPHAQRRIVELLRVALTGADVLLLDEPAAGLSAAERAEFSSLLRRLRDEKGKTIVLVEHDLKLVWDVADRITVLEAGRIVASGSPDEVRKNPNTRQLFVEPERAEAN